MIHVTKGLVPFWDDHMIDHRFTDAVLSVNKPVKTDSVMVFDQPWDGNANDFFTIVKDDGFYRMYYETWSFFDPTYTEGINVCYAESRDGIHWERPNLGMCEFRGSRDNNIIMTRIPDNIVVMKDGCAIRSGSKQEILSDISLETEGIQLPQYALLGDELIKRGMKLDYIPITEKQAIEVIGKAIKGGDC